jgi:hypothetical protein
MAAAVGLGRTATVASVRATGDDVPRPHHLSMSQSMRNEKDSFGCQKKFFYLDFGPPRMKSWNEPTESSLKPCGTPAGSKGSPRPGGRTVAGARGHLGQTW